MKILPAFFLVLILGITGCTRSAPKSVKGESDQKSTEAKPPARVEITSLSVTKSHDAFICASNGVIAKFHIEHGEISEPIYTRLGTRCGPAILSPDESTLAVQDTTVPDARIFLIDTATSQLVQVLHGASDAADFEFTSDSKYLVATNAGALIRWSVNGGPPLMRSGTKQANGGGLAGGFTLIPGTAGAYAWHDNDDQTSRSVWNSSTGQEEPASPLSWVPTHATAFVRDGRPKAFVADENRMLSLFDIPLHRSEKSWKIPKLWPEKLSPSGNWAGERDDDETGLRLAPISDLEPRASIQLDTGKIDQYWFFLNDQIVCNTFDGLTFYQTDSGALLGTWYIDLASQKKSFVDNPSPSYEWAAILPTGEHYGSLHHMDFLTKLSEDKVSEKTVANALEAILFQ